MLRRWLVCKSCMLGFVSPPGGLFGAWAESPPMDNSIVPKEKYTTAVSRDGSELTCSWAKMSRQIMPQWMSGWIEAAEINCCPGKCYLDLSTWSQPLWCSAQRTSVCSEMPPHGDRVHCKQAKWSWAPLKRKKELKRQHEHRRKHSTSKGWRIERFCSVKRKVKTANDKSKCSGSREKRPVVYGRREAAEKRRLRQGRLMVRKKEEDAN